MWLRMNKEVEKPPESESDAKIDPARLKVQRTNWKRLAGNELLKIQEMFENFERYL